MSMPRRILHIKSPPVSRQAFMKRWYDVDQPMAMLYPRASVIGSVPSTAQVLKLIA